MVAGPVASPVARLSPFTDQIRAVVGGAFFVPSVVYAVDVVRRSQRS